MRRFIYGLVLGTAVSLWATAQSIAGGGPETPWQITINGQDHGVMFLTFAAGTPPTNPVTGYGISLDALGPFAVTGTWDENEDGEIVCGFVQLIEGGSESGSFVTKMRGNGGLIARASTTHGPQKFKAPPAGPIPDLTGSWTASAVSAGKKELDSFTLTPATNNMPGWFDLTGTGIGESGSFALSGAVLVTTDRNAAGYTISNFGTGTLQASFIGKVSRKANKLTLRGNDENTKNVTIHAEKPKTK